MAVGKAQTWETWKCKCTSIGYHLKAIWGWLLLSVFRNYLEMLAFKNHKELGTSAGGKM